ncbi:MAG: 30S ribosome-binding factor RbfA [Clostridia bacterium]|nr:30S ribosome-binding factor RbfA [Clostridia bacterium]MBQ9774378.1 30S ribosome-binding factor RbfA [Clostridia bacterium]
MAKYRRGRINEEMQKELTVILRRVKDPRVCDAFISITAADCTADLKYAKIYYSAMGGDAKEIAQGLKAAAGFIRRELASSLNLRMTPELTFVPDSSVAYGAHIASILNKLDIRPEEETETETDETDGDPA